jgi:hypothetical protein
MSTVRGARDGVCHRCGWRGVVGKVRWRDRRQAAAPVPFSRLCQECADELLHGQTDVVRKDKPAARLRSFGHKDVA